MQRSGLRKYNCPKAHLASNIQNYTVPLMISPQYAGWGAKIGERLILALTNVDPPLIS